jgi:hypothetical protein
MTRYARLVDQAKLIADGVRVGLPIPRIQKDLLFLVKLATQLIDCIEDNLLNNPQELGVNLLGELDYPQESPQENQNSVTISESRLRELEKAEAMLQALEAGGVDNWQWYEDSLEEYWEKWEPED